MGRKRKRHSAEKPRAQQWCHTFPGGAFVCGRCKAFFFTRHRARSRRKICQGKYQRELERFTRTLRDRHTPAQKRRKMRILLGLPVYR